MKDNKIKLYIYSAVFAALTFVATYIIKIPIPVSGGYIHPGDAIIIAASLFLGPVSGAITGAIGSAMSDLLAGYAAYVIPTFIIKGIIGYITGKLCRSKKTSVLGFAIDIVVLCGGYYITDSFLTGSPAAALAGIPFNILQCVFGILCGCLIYKFARNKINL